MLCDGNSHKHTITMATLPTVFSWTAVPASGSVYLRGAATNSLNKQLLAGRMSVYLDSTFCCEVQLKATAPKASFFVFLGVDDMVTIRVLPDETFQKTAGMFKKENVKSFSRKIQLHNHYQQEIDLALFDQLPKSDNEKAKVKLIEPKESDVSNKEDGSKIFINEHNNLRFSLKLQGGEKVIVPFAYDISFPADMHLRIDEW